jgi:hypothetical protein
MTNEDKKLVFEYMGWKLINTKPITFIEAYNLGTFIHPLDGNDMVAAMNKMAEKRGWDKFAYLVKINLPYKVSFIEDIIHWIMQPARFFELMASWLKEKEHENT